MKKGENMWLCYRPSYMCSNERVIWEHCVQTIKNAIMLENNACVLGGIGFEVQHPMWERVVEGLRKNGFSVDARYIDDLKEIRYLVTWDLQYITVVDQDYLK